MVEAEVTAPWRARTTPMGVASPGQPPERSWSPWKGKQRWLTSQELLGRSLLGGEGAESGGLTGFSGVYFQQNNNN